MNFEPPSTGAKRFFDVAEALCLAVGNAIRPGFIEAVMAMLVVRRLQRVRGLLLVLEARFLAGRLRAFPGRGRCEVSVVRRDRAVLPVAMPRGFGWLCPLVPSYAATYAAHLRMVLVEPGMVALLAACPQAVRVVRPVCRMLGIARADYVPGERVPEAPVVLVAEVGSKPGPLRGEPVGVRDPLGVRDPTSAEVLTGACWVRFFPG